MNFDFNNYMKKVNFKKYNKQISYIKENLKNDDMTSWYDLDKCISREEIEDIKHTSEKIKDSSDIFVVVGIGGSFLGSKMLIDALSNLFNKNTPEIIFAGTTLSSSNLEELGEYIKDKRVTINVISKSGSTLETKLTFNYLYKIMEEKYSFQELKERIIITTDLQKSELLDFANEKNFKTFRVPSDIGGRYSVLTPVGLLPVSVAGFDIEKIISGAKIVSSDKAFEYATIRDFLYKKGFFIESFTFYDEKLSSFGEWLKQLFAETQGKNGKGILPITTINTRDLHSLGQYFQDGKRIIFETVITFKDSKNIMTSFDRSLNEINSIAVDSVRKAHFSNNLYSLLIESGEINEENMGYLIYFFEIAAAAGAYLLNVNPFDQPGVSKYKEIIEESMRK